MAKLKAPLMSLGAAGALGKSLVFFGWKGLDVVREYVVPANPRTALQVAQRAHLTFMVALMHTTQTLATNPLDALDQAAYSLWGSIYSTPRTWFNQLVKNGIDQRVAGLQACIYRDGTTTPGATQLAVECYRYKTTPNDITAAKFWYGTSKTALVHTQNATILADKISATLTGLSAGVKYFWQLRVTAHADYVGTRSGIYYGYPTA